MNTNPGPPGTLNPGNRNWRRNQIAVVAATFVGFTGFTLVMPFLSAYIQELGVTDTGEVALWTGITLGITPAIVALCAPLWGRVADRFGNKLLVQRSLFSCVVVMALMAKATEPWQLFALRAAQGLLAGYGPLTLTMAARSAPPEQMASAIGAVQTAQRFGPAIGPAHRRPAGVRGWSAQLVPGLVARLRRRLRHGHGDVQGAPRRCAASARDGRARELLERAGVRELSAAHAGDLRPADGRPQLRAGAAAARDADRLRVRPCEPCSSAHCFRRSRSPGSLAISSLRCCCGGRRPAR